MAARGALPRHTRVPNPPRGRLTQRDVEVLVGVYNYRVLRRDQIQQLFFPSKNTTNERLKFLYQHCLLQRRWLPVEYGQGMGQALYLLDRCGADIVAQALDVDRGQLGWRCSHNLVSSYFLRHTLTVNDIRVAITLGARHTGHRLLKWITEEELGAKPEYVYVLTKNRSQKVAVIPDGYFILGLGDRRAHFFVEADRATVSNRRWALRIRAYQEYVRSGKYAQRYGARSLRVLTVTSGERRLANLKRTTEQAGGGARFWFTTLTRATSGTVLSAPIWQIAGLQEAYAI